MISVCLPTYNGSEFIIEQITSILNQLSGNDEIIISDDCSTDNTLQLIRELNDDRIKIFENNKFISYIFNFENSIKKAHGDIIFLSDQDDVWLPNKVAEMCLALKDTDFVLSDCYVTDKDLNIVSESYYSIRKTKKNKFISLLGGSPYLGCCMAFNRRILTKVLPFPSYISSHDIWIGNVASFFYKSVFIDNKLIYYRRHNQNISTFAGKSKTSIFEKITTRTLLLKALISRILF